MRLRRALPLLAALVACDSPSGPADGLDVATTATSYTRSGAGSRADVGYTVHNGGESTVYLSACGVAPTAVAERRAGSRWMDADGTICIAVLPMVPVPVAPGTSVNGAFVLGASGVYRLRLLAHATVAGDGVAVRSNTFEVR